MLKAGHEVPPITGGQHDDPVTMSEPCNYCGGTEYVCARVDDLAEGQKSAKEILTTALRNCFEQCRFCDTTALRALIAAGVANERELEIGRNHEMVPPESHQ